MTASQPFSITVDQVGHGTVQVDGEDVTNRVSGLELFAAPGTATRLVLHTLRGGTVNGDALVEVVDVTPADLAAAVRAIPPGEIRKEADADLNNDLSSDMYQMARDAIARILSR